MELFGTETLTLELAGTMARGAAPELPGGLAWEERDGRVPVALLLFRMHGMRPRGVPAPSFDYGEALWRLGTRLGEQAVWFALRCDLDHALIKTVGRIAIRYPVRDARFRWIDGEEPGVVVRAGGSLLSVHAELGHESPAPVPPRRLIVRAGERLFEIPWREDPAPFRRTATLRILDASLAEATLGSSVAWESQGLVHRGRVHRCGLARRLPVRAR